MTSGDVIYFYEFLHFDDYFSDSFKWDYEHHFKDLDFIKAIRMKLISRGYGEEGLIEGICNELFSEDEKYIKVIEDKFFRTDFDYVISRECEYCEDSILYDEIKKVEKELYKKIKSEMEVA